MSRNYSKHIISLSLGIAGLLAFQSLNDNSPVNKAVLGAPEPIGIAQSAEPTGNIILQESFVNWNGRKATGGHSGTIGIKPTSELIGNTTTKLLSALIVLDMTSIASTDLSGDMAKKLDGHLKSSDFFDVDQFPNTTIEIFELTKKLPADNKLKGANFVAKGNLTVKGVSKSIKFPVIVSYDKNKVTVSSELSFDRTEFDVMYASEENLKDKLIEKDVILKFRIQAVLSN